MHAFLFLTHQSKEQIIERFKDLQKSVIGLGTVIYLYHNSMEELPDELNGLPVYSFTDAILFSLGYTPIEKSLVPGSNHFPLLAYYREHPNYDYYWVIEDDVFFNGDWKVFFEYFSDYHKEDFVSTHLRSFDEEPGWYWWESLGHSRSFIPFYQRIRSFNPIYRLSNRALMHLNNCLLNSWTGHHEVLVPTLLRNFGYTIADMGGVGKFVAERNKNRFYLELTSKAYYGALSTGTIRHRPLIRKEEIADHKLYHPVKLYE